MYNLSVVNLQFVTSEIKICAIESLEVDSYPHRLAQNKGCRKPTLIWGGGGCVSIELLEYAIFIKLPEFYWMHFKT